MENQQIAYVPMYKSYIDAVAKLTSEDRLAIYEAIFEYGFTGIEPTFDNPYLEMGWNLVKPNLVNNISRVKSNQENGKKGGRPSKKVIETKEPITETLPTQVIEDIKLENKVAEIEDNESLNELKEILDSEYPMKTDIERLLISVIKNTNSYQLSELSKKIKKEDIKGDSIKEFLISNNIELK
jgi:hypothetical protein